MIIPSPLRAQSDPPSFATSEAQIKRALIAYARLTRLALGVLSPGGTLVMASCSSRVTPARQVVH